MTKEELEKEARINLKRRFGEFFPQLTISYVMGAEPREKRIAELEKRCANYEMTISKMEKGTCDICKETEKDNRIVDLEEKISVLLSCKKCPENKGGYICAKEYENKCLAQKIQFIKELQEENAELRKDKKELCHSISEGGKACVYLNEQLTKATKIIKKLYAVYYAPCVTESDLKYRDELFAEIKQFLSEVNK